MATPIGLDTIAEVREAGGLTSLANLYVAGADTETIYAAASRMFASPDASRVSRLLQQASDIAGSGSYLQGLTPGEPLYYGSIPVNPQLTPPGDPGARFYIHAVLTDPNNPKVSTSIYLATDDLNDIAALREQYRETLMDRAEASPKGFSKWSPGSLLEPVVTIAWVQRRY